MVGGGLIPSSHSLTPGKVSVYRHNYYVFGVATLTGDITATSYSLCTATYTCEIHVTLHKFVHSMHMYMHFT